MSRKLKLVLLLIVLAIVVKLIFAYLDDDEA